MEKAAIIFWVCAGYLLYVYALHPLLLWLFGSVHHRRIQGLDRPLALDVGVILVVRNQQERIKARIQNLLASDLRSSTLKIVVVSDGSTDGTVRRIREVADARVHLIDNASRTGRSASLSAAVAACPTSDVLVVLDAELNLRADTLRKLCAPFKDPSVGATCGVVHNQPLPDHRGCGMQVLQKFEAALRALESRVDSVPSCTPSIYATRRALFPRLLPDPQPDHIAVALAVLAKGRRAVLARDAVAYVVAPANGKSGAFLRRRRRMAALVEGCLRNPGWFVPWRNRLAARFAMHEVLRLLTPVALILFFVSNAMLMTDGPVFAGFMIVQLAFYTFAIAGGFGLMPRGWLVCNLPLVLLSQAAAVPVGVVDCLRGRFRIEPHSRREQNA